MALPVLGGRWLLSTEQGHMPMCQRYGVRPQASGQQDQGVPLQQRGSLPQFLCSGGPGRRLPCRGRVRRGDGGSTGNEQSQQGLAAPRHGIPVPGHSRLSSMVYHLPACHQGWSLDLGREAHIEWYQGSVLRLADRRQAQEPHIPPSPGPSSHTLSRTQDFSTRDVRTGWVACR